MKQAHVWADVYKRRLFSMMEIVLRLSLSLFHKKFYYLSQFLFVSMI